VRGPEAPWHHERHPGEVEARLDAAGEFRTVRTPDQQKVVDKNLDKVKMTWGRKSH